MKPKSWCLNIVFVLFSLCYPLFYFGGVSGNLTVLYTGMLMAFAASALVLFFC